MKFFCDIRYLYFGLIFVLMSCAPDAQSEPKLGTPGVVPVSPGKIAADTERVPIFPFPTAAVVKAYVGFGLTVSAEGNVTENLYNAFPHPKNAEEYPVPAYDTAVLTEQEVQKLKSSFFFTLKSKYTSPNFCGGQLSIAFYNAFTFYDKVGKYLGDFASCPYTSYGVVSPMPADTSGLPMLNYDGDTFRKIFSAHSLDAPLFTGTITADTQKISAPIFPTATLVKAYIGDNLGVSNDGTVTSGNTFPRGSGTPEPVPAEDTAILTQTEIRALQNSVYFTQYPEAAAACICDFRHAFTFFDGAGHYLGHFAVCFGCGCTDLSSQPVNATGLPALNWDRSVLQKIFNAHHLNI